MTYELAKQLKDAGFHQDYGNNEARNICQHRTPQSRDEECYHILNSETCEICYCPTLSELIEACGEGFRNLQRSVIDERLWLCNYDNGNAEDTYESWEAEGTTPEEAVARLWLALNK